MKSTLKLKIVLGFLVITGCTGVSNKPNVNTSSKPEVATITTSIPPTNDVGNTSSIAERGTLNGNVYNEKGELVEYAFVKAKSVENNVSWVAEYQLTAGGVFVIRNSPVGAKVEITVSKDGVSKSKIVTVKSNLNGDPKANKFDFGHSTEDKNSDNSDFLKVEALSENKDPFPENYPYPNQSPMPSWNCSFSAIPPSINYDFPVPSATPTPVPTLFNIDESRVTLKGNVYNYKGLPVDFVIVRATTMDKSWFFTPELTSNGLFIIRDVPVNRKIQITIIKDGVQKSKTVLSVANPNNDSKVNLFDFGHSANDKNSDNNDFLNIDVLPNNGFIRLPYDVNPSALPAGWNCNNFNQGIPPDVKERATFTGNVYNEKGESVEYAFVKAKSVENNISWIAESQQTSNGSFLVRNAPVGAKIEIIVSKNGVSKSRVVILSSNINGDPYANKFDFGHSVNDKSSDNSDFLTVNALAENTDPLPSDFPRPVFSSPAPQVYDLGNPPINSPPSN